MNRYKLIRMLLEEAGTPADAGSAGTSPAGNPPAAGEPPKTGPATDGTQAPQASKNTDTAAADGGNQSLLGGAKAADTKPADGSAGDNPDGGNTQKPGDGQQDPAADPYKDLTLPDGAAVDEKEMAKYKELAKNLNLKAEDAQRILDFEAERLSAGAAAAAAAWQEQVKQEHGDKLPVVMATCARAMDKLGGKELRDLLDQTGLGNHPVMVNAFFKAGSLIKEDTSVGSSGTAQGDVTLEQALYGCSKR